MVTGQVLLGRHGLPLLPLLHVRLLPWHLWRRLVYFCLHFILLRYPEAFPLHRDPEAHIPSEEQGRQQRQTGKNSDTDMVSFMLFRCLRCHWPSTTDRGSWPGARWLFSRPIIARQVQPEEVHGTAVPGKGREFPPSYRNILSLPQLVRCFRYKDLYDNVLFNYQVSKHSLLIFINSSQWLYNKMCALPLPEVISITCPYTFDTGYWIYESK